MSERIHVSVGWPYANGDLHIGHLAGAYLPADIFARYHRLKGNQVLMVSGSDSHGTPITVESLKAGIETVNAKRKAMHRLARLRRADPAPISGLDALLANQVFFFLLVCSFFSNKKYLGLLESVRKLIVLYSFYTLFRCI